ncbi:unnamed protein product [Spirodela intermedia]|uniref:Epidermal patterning factor-like protein n=1 Tax=Spirodela intermedia TaxID=51605 RepID=A0A7I8K612_SPIIN|nr:unnamed protein product [Spirodela intermedia]
MVFSETDRDLRQSSLDNCRRRERGPLHREIPRSLLLLLLSLSLSLLSTATAGNSCGRERKPTAAAAEEELWRRSTITAAAAARGRSLLGPGSYPPRCSSKCGDCTPCRPVHVAVPPGTPVLTEYYPEAWRCKCGGRLYMP